LRTWSYTTTGGLSAPRRAAPAGFSIGLPFIP
jgi:hypothetical protein